MNIPLADAAQLVAIVVAVILVFWRGSAFTKQVTDAITASEGRLRDEITASEERLRTENREAHAGITRNIEDVNENVRMLTQHLLNRAAPPDA